MPGLLRKKLASIKRMARYAKEGDGLSAYRCALDEMLGRERLHSITINGYSIAVRTHSADIIVALDCLHYSEFASLNLAAPRVIIDAGANIGASSMFFAATYPNARIFAIEPESGNFALLKQNTRDYPNIVPIQAALWGSIGRRTVHDRLTGHWGYTLADTANKTEPTGQVVNCVTLDSLMQEHRITSIDLLKMDIEGGEKDVLEHSHSWIDAIDTMTVELHDRILMGCDRAFYLATKDFTRFERHGEKVTAYRK